jgi:2-oxoglutarate ferredoxin oxidoreductase subunit beta
MRLDALPTLFCPGCGNGIVQHAMIAAVDKLGVRDDVAFVSGIGCSSWIPCYFDMDVMHTTHGRAMAFAQGLKLVRPDKKIIVVTGDGDCLAIGGNHFLHACKRNIDLTVILVNNHIYGMTGGQKSPATPKGACTKTSPWGVYEEPMSGAETAVGLGASYVARWTAAHPVQLQKSIEEGINHNGFSLIEVISPCPTQSGKEIYGDKDPANIMECLKKTKCGVLSHDNDRPEYIGQMKERIRQWNENQYR